MSSNETARKSDALSADDECKVDPQGGARFCKKCREAIYIGSTLPEDRYTTADGYYYHTACQ